MQARNELPKDFEALRAQFNTQKTDTCHVAAGPIETLDQSHLHGIAAASRDEDNGDAGGHHLGRFGSGEFCGEDEVHSILDQLARCGGQRSLIPLGKADTEDKLLVLAIPEIQQTVPQCYYLWRGPPRLRQRSEPDGAGTLRSARLLDEQTTAH